MKQTLTAFCLSVTCLFCFAQSFEGQIIYKTTFKSKSPTMTDEAVASLMGGMKDFYIKGGNYKIDNEGTSMLWRLYINADNKLYYKFFNSDVLVWDDATIDQEKVTSTELRTTNEKILGYDCNEVILHCNTGTWKYYFNTKLFIDSRLFSNCLIDSWYPYLLKANAVPLKIVNENADFIMESTAVAVNQCNSIRICSLCRKASKPKKAASKFTAPSSRPNCITNT